MKRPTGLTAQLRNNCSHFVSNVQFKNAAFKRRLFPGSDLDYCFEKTSKHKALEGFLSDTDQWFLKPYFFSTLLP